MPIMAGKLVMLPSLLDIGNDLRYDAREDIHHE